MVAIRRTRPLGPFGALVLGFIVLCAGVALFSFLAADYTLNCIRHGDTCTLEKERLFHEKEITANLKLSDVAGAEIQESRDSKEKSHYEVMLLTRNLRIPFSDGTQTGYGSCSRTVDRINNFIHSSEESLSVTQSATLARIAGFIFAAAGAYVMLCSLSTMLKRILRLMVSTR